MLVPVDQGELFPSYLQEHPCLRVPASQNTPPLGGTPKNLYALYAVIFLKAPLISSKEGKKFVEIQPSEACFYSQKILQQPEK